MTEWFKPDEGQEHLDGLKPVPVYLVLNDTREFERLLGTAHETTDNKPVFAFRGQWVTGAVVKWSLRSVDLE